MNIAGTKTEGAQGDVFNMAQWIVNNNGGSIIG